MAYDEKCYELAECFLDDTDTQDIMNAENIGELAQRIQDVIEGFITEKHGQ